jgi:serine protease
VDGGNLDTEGVPFLAAHDDVLAVGAVTEEEELASFSQFGPELDIVAPGTNVVSTVPGGSYRQLSGISMAVPAVSGVAALGIAASDDDPGHEKVRSLLKDHAREIGLPADKQGAGHVDASVLSRV